MRRGVPRSCTYWVTHVLTSPHLAPRRYHRPTLVTLLKLLANISGVDVEFTGMLLPPGDFSDSDSDGDGDGDGGGGSGSVAQEAAGGAGGGAGAGSGTGTGTGTGTGSGSGSSGAADGGKKETRVATKHTVARAQALATAIGPLILRSRPRPPPATVAEAGERTKQDAVDRQAVIRVVTTLILRCGYVLQDVRQELRGIASVSGGSHRSVATESKLKQRRLCRVCVSQVLNDHVDRIKDLRNALVAAVNMDIPEHKTLLHRLWGTSCCVNVCNDKQMECSGGVLCMRACVRVCGCTPPKLQTR